MRVPLVPEEFESDKHSGTSKNCLNNQCIGFAQQAKSLG